MPQNPPGPLCGVATSLTFSPLQPPKGSPGANTYTPRCTRRSPGDHKPTNSPLRAAKSPKMSEKRAESPYLTEDEPPDEEEQDSRHDARKKG